MKSGILIPALFLALTASAADGQHVCQRIEQMPSLPQPYAMRQWKDVARKYISLVLNPGEGEHMPLCVQTTDGFNYPEFNPLRLDTYVGWNDHGKGSEAINAMPAVVTAYLTGAESLSNYSLAEGVINFFNSRNGQNVYLNNFAAKSGGDWWYDLMPNVYFYQLCNIAPMPDAELAAMQYRSVADRWLEAVYAMGGDSYDWTVPQMGYRAFNLATMKPLDSGVKEPESAGTIAWLLMHAWMKTGDARYRAGAELSMEYLNSLGSNPAYELQLPYGVQAAAKMNALLGTGYRVDKMFDNCFDRGYLRGWGSIVGTWGGYDVSGLIGEANDKGNDYAFVMNGFQQMAALAPAVRYDKRLARAFGRWAVNVANASRLFYRGFLPDKNMEETSRKWSETYDPDAVIPYESMKEVWGGVTPYAMGDALGGKWAATNLSLYSGSSVGYMAAVVETTDVEGILQLDLTATDMDGTEKYPTYLYYNPYDVRKTVTLPLADGDYRLYDLISEKTLSEKASGSFALDIASDNVVMVAVIPASAQVSTEGRVMYADGIAVDYHTGYDFETKMRIKHLEADNASPARGETVTLHATLSGVPENGSVAWSVDGNPIDGTSTALSISTSAMDFGQHTVMCTVTAGDETASASTVIEVTDGNKIPEIDMASTSGNMNIISVHTLTGLQLTIPDKGDLSGLPSGIYIVTFEKEGVTDSIRMCLR